MGSIPGLGRYFGGGNGNPLHILAWRIPWTEDSGGLWSRGSQSQTQPNQPSTAQHRTIRYVVGEHTDVVGLWVWKAMINYTQVNPYAVQESTA